MPANARDNSLAASKAVNAAAAPPHLSDFRLHKLRAPRSGLSIVFVHGVLSDGERAWGKPPWPEILVADKDLEDAGVFVFTYRTGISSGTYSIGDAADALREDLTVSHLWDQKGLAFVCHSMGGIVVRRFLVANQIKLIESRCSIGLFLLASPSIGSRDANVLGLLASALRHTQGKALRFSQDNVWLNDLDKDFVALKDCGRLHLKGKELIEEKAIAVRRCLGLWRQTVEPFSAARYFPEPYKVPGSDHGSICKPGAPSAIQHELLKHFIGALRESSTTSARSTGVEPVVPALDVEIVDGRTLIAARTEHTPGASFGLSINLRLTNTSLKPLAIQEIECLYYVRGCCSFHSTATIESGPLSSEVSQGVLPQSIAIYAASSILASYRVSCFPCSPHWTPRECDYKQVQVRVAYRRDSSRAENVKTFQYVINRQFEPIKDLSGPPLVGDDALRGWFTEGLLTQTQLDKLLKIDPVCRYVSVDHEFDTCGMCHTVGSDLHALLWRCILRSRA